MGYAGQTFNKPGNRGGMSPFRNEDMIPPEGWLNIRNMNLSDTMRIRGGTSVVTLEDMLVEKDPIAGSPRIVGMIDFRLDTGSQFFVIATADGNIYKTGITTIKTGLTGDLITQMEVFNETLYISNGTDLTQTWDGVAASTSDLSNPNENWSSGNYPKQIFKHIQGNSVRLVALGVANQPNTVYIADPGTDDFTAANVKTFPIDTGNDPGLIGGISFKGHLIVFGRSRAYKIDTSDLTVANWTYTKADWDGGVASWRLIIETPTDIVCMDESGEIYSVVAAEQGVDLERASLVRPSQFNEWISEKVNLSQVENFWGLFDPNIRAVKIFVTQNGSAFNDTALCYFIDRPPGEAWTYHEGRAGAKKDSGYEASTGCLYRVSAGDIRFKTGDYAGRTWDLERSGLLSDNLNQYPYGFKTPALALSESRTEKHFKRYWIESRSEGTVALTGNVWIDDVLQTEESLTLSPIIGDVYGTGVYGTAVYSKVETLRTPVDIDNTGDRIQIELEGFTENQDFALSNLRIDFKPLGRPPT